MSRIILAMIFIMFSCASFSEGLEKVSVELKWFHQFQFAGIYAAKEKGFYRDEGLDVDIIERNPKSSPIKDVLDGKATFGVSDATLIRDRLLGHRVVLLAAIFQHSPLVLISLAKNNYLSPLELRGKRVMYQVNVDDAVIVGMFNEFGMSKKDYIPVDHTFKDDALLNSDIDAMSSYLSNQPYLYKKLGIPINIIKPENYGVDFYGDLIFTSEKYFKSHKEESLAFRRATLRGWEYALNHPDEIIEWLQNKYHSKKTKEALVYEAEVTRRLISPDVVSLGSVSKNRVENIAQIYIKNDPKLSNDNNLNGFYYKDYIYSEEDYYQIAIIIFISAIIVLVIIFILIYLIKRLKNSIAIKAQEISEAKKNLEDYVSIINKAVLLIKVDKDSKIIDVSDAFKKVMGFSQEALLGKQFFGDVTKVKNHDIHKIMVHLKENKVWRGECEIRDANYTYHEFDIEVFLHGDNKNVFYYIVLRDITDQKTMEDISVTDTLTKIPNRFGLNRLLNKAWLDANEQSLPLSVVIIDIDYFKQVNDQFGHAKGDYILRTVAMTMSADVRSNVHVGRWGGEEFLMICKDTPLADAIVIAERMRKQIALVEVVRGRFITASFGVAELVRNEAISDLIKRADIALYNAKEQGRNRVCKG